jgi:dephospho-CoA kinase
MICMPDHSRIIVGVAGRIGSGKTRVAQEIAGSFGFQYFRYSLVLAEWFGANPADKAGLQEIGEGVMSGEGQRELNQRLISRIPHDRDAVIDGLRHPIDYASLKHEFQDRFFLIFIEAPFDIRFERLRSRFTSVKKFSDADRRLVESNIDSLRPMASAMLSGTLQREELNAELSGLLRKFRQKVKV